MSLFGIAAAVGVRIGRREDFLGRERNEKRMLKREIRYMRD
jgi:hypothetical protein